MQISLDGFSSTGPNDEQKWVTWAWDEIKQEVLDLANSCDTELIGRKLAVDYIPFWTDTLSQPESMMYEVAKIKEGQKKIVFSHTLKSTGWDSAKLSDQPLEELVPALKQQAGKDILVGSRSLILQLMALNLIDEYQFCIHPVVIGSGLPLFENVTQRPIFNLVKTKTFGSGAITLYYEPATSKTMG